MDTLQSWKAPVIARKHYNGVTIGFIVGWKHRWDSRVRNIRANLIFKTVEEAKEFKANMESKRVNPWVEFEIIKD
jgi:hypothetical protein